MLKCTADAPRFLSRMVFFVVTWMMFLSTKIQSGTCFTTTYVQQLHNNNNNNNNYHKNSNNKNNNNNNQRYHHNSLNDIQQQKQQQLINSRIPLYSKASDESTTGNSYDRENNNLRPSTSFGSEIVPENQRPINEYLDVTSQPMFDWASTNTGTKGLVTRLVFLYSLLFGFICYPISGATYTLDGYLLPKLISSNVGATFVLLIVMIRLYTGWEYIGKRLTSKIIEYEETGWYDGSYELKTETELKRDRFLYNSDVKPVVDRCRTVLYGTIAYTILSCISLKIINEIQPIPFNQYDPNVLERLVYDDKLADSAAAFATSNGNKPAYCDSRYYQAIANGGQGCN